jgi:hypothetical protein
MRHNIIYLEISRKPIPVKLIRLSKVCLMKPIFQTDEHLADTLSNQDDLKLGDA